MQEEIREFYKFCKEKVSLYGIAIFTYLSYSLLSRGAIGIDDESMDNYLGSELIAQDRVGWSLTNSIFKSYSFVPSWTIMIGIIFAIIGLLLWFYGLEKKADIAFSKRFLTLTVGILISFPYIAKFAIFNGNMTAIGYVLIFTTIALYASYSIWEKIQIKQVFILLLCLCMIFLFEKTYAVLFVQGMILFALVKCCNANERIPSLKFVKWFGTVGIGVVVAFLISKVIINAIHVVTGIPSNGYTSSYITYNLTGIKEFFVSFWNFIPQYLVSESNKINLYFAEKIYIIAVLSMCILMIYSSIKKRDYKIILLSLVAIMLSQAVFVVTGNIYMPIRSYCFNYVFFIGTVVVMGRIVLKNKGSVICCIVALWLIGTQSKEMQEVYYNKIITFEKDRYYAENILTTIEKECGAIATYNKPIVFMGFQDNDSINYGEPEETSMFIWGRNESVYLEESSTRVFRFLDELGYSLVRPANQGIDYYDVRKQISSMPAYPSEGCVKELDNCIIVKLGDSLCEIIDANEMDWESSENLIASIEWFNSDNRSLLIQGWLVNLEKSSYNNNISLVLKNEGEAYRIRIDEKKRSDVTLYLNDGNNYDNSGFYLNTYLSEYVKDGSYQVYLEIRDDEGEYLYNLNQSVFVGEI